jgi:protein O-mannosyl-transferase
MNVNRTTLVGVALVIFAGTVWLYWPSVQGGFLTGMDDDEYLRQAERCNGLTCDAVKWAFTTTEPYYHPLPRLSHVLDYQMWGKNAAGHHMTSVVVHALNAALVFGFLWTLLGAAALTAGERLAMALGVAVVFAIHPLQVESVAWMSGRTQLLCTTFGIGCLWAYVYGARRWVVGTLFAGALLSKPMAVSLPFVMLAIDYFPLRRFERLGWASLLREKAVFIALGLAAAAITIISESHTGGLMVPLVKIHWPQRVFLVVQSFLFYPWKLVWPMRLEPYYPLLSGTSARLLPLVPMALSVAVITALCVRCGRRSPALPAGLGAYAMLILPVSGVLQTGLQTVATRHAYLAMLPLLLLAGGMVLWAWRFIARAIHPFRSVRARSHERRGATVTRLTLGCLLAGELCFFGLRTRSLIPVWRNDETLWRAVLMDFPDFARGHYGLGFALAQAGRTQEAIGEYMQAVQLQPDFAEVHNNLGVAFLQLGRTHEAVAEYEQALRIKPDYVDAHHNLEMALGQTGKTEDAVEQYEQALRINPNFAEAHDKLGVALAKAGRVSEAMEQWEEALRIDPNFAEAHYNYGVTLQKMGKFPEAIGHYEQALQIDPDRIEAQYNLGAALEKAGRVPEAIQHYQQALRLRPDLTAARNALTRLGAGQ